jgi:dihydroorotase
MLKRGDVLTHPYNPPSMNSSNLFGNDVDPQADKVLPQILELKNRGIFTDGQLATTHSSWQVEEKASSQGWFPDTLSTDIGRTPDGNPASVLVSMSVALHLGMPLDAVIAAATSTPAKVMNAPEKIGTLEPGTTADVSVIELQQGNVDYPDQGRQTRALKQQFVPVATIKGGIFLKGSAPSAVAGRGGPPAGGGGGGRGAGSGGGGGRGGAGGPAANPGS